MDRQDKDQNHNQIPPEKIEQDRNRKLNQGDFSHLVNPEDAVEVQREQETKSARTVSGPGETSVSKDEPAAP